MGVSVETTAAEPAIGRAAIRLAARTRHRRIPGTAVLSRYETHRYGADRRTSHQCQHHTTRALHGCDPVFRFSGAGRVSITSWQRGKQKRGVSRQFAGKGRPIQPPKEKFDPKLCANEPKPPRVTPPEPESD